MWRGPQTNTAVIIHAHALHGWIAEKWYRLSALYAAETTDASWEDMERFDMPLRQDSVDIVNTLKASFVPMAEVLRNKWNAAFGIDLTDRLDFLNDTYVAEGAEETFISKCYELLRDSDNNLDVLVANALRQFGEPRPIPWKEAQDIQFVNYEQELRRLRRHIQPFRVLVRWKGTLVFVESKTSQFYEGDQTLRQTLRTILDDLEQGLNTRNNGLDYDWRTASVADSATLFPLTRGMPSFTIERDMYTQSYLISQNGESMEIVNTGVLLGTVQLRDFLNRKATAIRMLLRHKHSLTPIASRMCTVCLETCEERYAQCCDRIYCNVGCQTKDWAQHKRSCKRD